MTHNTADDSPFTYWQPANRFSKYEHWVKLGVDPESQRRKLKKQEESIPTRDQIEYYTMEGLYLFNTSPEYGMHYLTSKFLLDKDVPNFLFKNKALIVPEKLGVFFSTNSAIIPIYISQFSFKGLQLLPAFRRLLQFVQPPKSTKSVTAFMRAFIAKYIHDNKQLPDLTDEEVVRYGNVAVKINSEAYDLYVVLYACVMVHSEMLHVDQLEVRGKKQKYYWTKSRFVKEMEHLTNIPEPYLVMQYDLVMQGSLYLEFDMDKVQIHFKKHDRNREWDKLQFTPTSPMSADSLESAKSSSPKNLFRISVMK